MFRSQGLRVIRTPIRSPRANAFAERFVNTVRRECLDHLLVVSRRHLQNLLSIYIGHYNRHRPHPAESSKFRITEGPSGGNSGVMRVI